MKKICVYCGSSPGRRPEYVESARVLARELVARNISLVYGGGNVGIMGKLADAVLTLGGEVIGVIPQALVDKEVCHQGLSELMIVQSMHERKATMADLSDGFIALPGGFGTIEELFEVLTWSQLGFHQKPCALLNVQGYYNSLAEFMDHAAEEQFVKQIHRNMLLIAEQPQQLLDLMFNYNPPLVDKWISRNDT